MTAHRLWQFPHGCTEYSAGAADFMESMTRAWLERGRLIPDIEYCRRWFGSALILHGRIC